MIGTTPCRYSDDIVKLPLFRWPFQDTVPGSYSTLSTGSPPIVFDRLATYADSSYSHFWTPLHSYLPSTYIMYPFYQDACSSITPKYYPGQLTVDI